MDEDNAAVGWQASSSRRGTLTIIENSLFTIFACTWSIQHLNVPALGEKGWKTLPRKCKWTAFTVFFPEFLMAHAILEFVMAVDDMGLLNQNGWLHALPWWYRCCRKMLGHSRPIFGDSSDEETAPGSKSETASASREQQWTLTHCYFANMGGFYLRERPNSSSETSSYSEAAPSSRAGLPLEARLPFRVGPPPEADSSSEAGLPTATDPSSEAGRSSEASSSSGDIIRIVTARHFADFWESIETPELSVEDLKDKSKTDYFTKALALVQIGQLLLSLIVRKTRHLAFSQLETLTLAFAICGVLTYICYWYKPQDVKRPIEVWLRYEEDNSSGFQQRHFDRLWEVLTNSETSEVGQAADRIRNDNIPKAAPDTTHYALYVLAILTAGFGSIHAIAWNFEFPTPAEQLLWRIATLVSSAVPPFALLAIPLSQILVPWGDPRKLMRDCQCVLREFSWGVGNKEHVRAAIESLEAAFDDIEKVPRHYSEIFIGETPDDSSVLCEQLLDFVQKDFNDGNSLELPDEFLAQFSQLVDILDANSESRWPRGLARPRRLIEAAKTNVYPQRVLFTRRFNLGIIYTTSIMYCLARLSIIGVAFSSLRLMPDSVYLTTWATNIPSLQ
jgi:hypothetical protein